MNALRLLQVSSAISLAIACGGSAGEQEPTPAPNDLRSSDAALTGCEDVLVPREALPRCDGETCAQVQREPERIVHWQLNLQHDHPINDYQFADLSADVLEHQLDCVLRQLTRLGVAPERKEGSAPREYDDITLEASFAQIDSVLHTAAVNSMELRCAELDCQRCEALSESDCRADAFCWPLEAQRLDAARGCWERRYAGCYVGNASCGDALTNGVSPDGACWLFTSTCQPRGFSSSSAAPACGYASFDAAPQCAP